MTSHILLSAIDPTGPVTFSRRVLLDLLRTELGYEGVIVSDALDMHGASGELGIPAAAVRALDGGCDLLCIGTRNTDAQLDEIEAAVEAAIAEGSLAESRVTDAAARVARLGARFAVGHDRSERGVAGSAEPGVDLARVASAFDVRPGTELGGPHRIVGLDTVANIAVGTVPWAPFARSWIGEGDEVGRVLDAAPKGTRLVLIGRDNHRHPWVREAISAARREHPGVVVVDMGWPSDDRAWADVATFGASRLVGDALRQLLGVAQEPGGDHG